MSSRSVCRNAADAAGAVPLPVACAGACDHGEAEAARQPRRDLPIRMARGHDRKAPRLREGRRSPGWIGRATRSRSPASWPRPGPRNQAGRRRCATSPARNADTGPSIAHPSARRNQSETGPAAGASLTRPRPRGRAGDAGGRRNSASRRCRRSAAPSASRPHRPRRSWDRRPTRSTLLRSLKVMPSMSSSSPPMTRWSSCFAGSCLGAFTSSSVRSRPRSRGSHRP